MVLICVSWIIYKEFNKWNRKKIIIHMKNKSDSYLTSDMQINSRWIKDSNIKSKTLKLSGKKYEWVSLDLEGREGFLKHWTQKSPLSSKCDDFDYIEIKN